MALGLSSIIVAWRLGEAVSLPLSPVPVPSGAISAVVVLDVPHVAPATERGGAAANDCLRRVLRALRVAENEAA